LVLEVQDSFAPHGLCSSRAARTPTPAASRTV